MKVIDKVNELLDMVIKYGVRILSEEEKYFLSNYDDPNIKIPLGKYTSDTQRLKIYYGEELPYDVSNQITLHVYPKGTQTYDRYNVYLHVNQQPKFIIIAKDEFGNIYDENLVQYLDDMNVGYFDELTEGIIYYSGKLSFEELLIYLDSVGFNLY